MENLLQKIEEHLQKQQEAKKHSEEKVCASKQVNLNASLPICF